MSTSSDRNQEPSRQVETIPIDSLLAHERIIPERLDEIVRTLESDGVLNLPILVDDDTNVILDGHHRTFALRELKATTVPALKIRYRDDPGIDLAPGPNCPVDSLTRSLVLEMGQSDKTFPPKSTRHRVSFDYPKVNTPLSELRSESD